MAIVAKSQKRPNTALEASGILLVEETDEYGNTISPASGSAVSATLDALTITYSYDLFNRLTESKAGKKITGFTYTADDYRLSKSSDTETAVYFYEGDKVAFEEDASGAVTAVNHVGTSTYARTIFEEGAETTFYYRFNAYGDVTALTGTDGTTIAEYEYDAFGNLTSQPDTKVNNSITYRGYEYDAETGLYYLNARYYDSTTARFLTEDTYRGEKKDPLSLNLYTYCKNNPLKYIDVEGHMAVEVLRALSKIYNTNIIPSGPMSMSTLILNGAGFFTALHEIAQLNLAKELEKEGYATTLEYRVDYLDDGKRRRGEVDVVGYRDGANYAWEIKPLGTDGSEQVNKYCLHGDLYLGGSFKTISNIEVFGNIKMKIEYSNKGVASYSLYDTTKKDDPVRVYNTEAQEEYKKNVARAAVVAGTIVVLTLVEDILSGGAGISDDIPTLNAAYAAFSFVFTH